MAASPSEQAALAIYCLPRSVVGHRCDGEEWEIENSMKGGGSATRLLLQFVPGVQISTNFFFLSFRSFLLLSASCFFFPPSVTSCGATVQSFGR